MNNFKLKIREGRVVGNNPYVHLGREEDNLIKIVVAIFDLEGFTDFFSGIRINKNIVVTSFVNGLLYWFSYRFGNYYRFSPIFSKFLGDGIMMIWEPGHQAMSNRDIVGLMNVCWDMVRARSVAYEHQYVPEFVAKIGKRYSVQYPKKMRVGLSLSHTVKYTRRGKVSDYVAESINIASRLVKFHQDIYFIAHSDLLFGEIPKKFRYIQKLVDLRGTGEIGVYIDKVDYERAGSPKVFKNLTR